MRGEKSLCTIWTDLGDEFPEIFNLCSAQTLENAAMEQEMIHPMTEVKEKRYKAVSPGTLAKNRGRKNMEHKTRWIRYQNA